jgi:hypothetical protein
MTMTIYEIKIKNTYINNEISTSIKAALAESLVEYLDLNDKNNVEDYILKEIKVI